MSTDQRIIPRPEYPRPQFVRPLWVNLNGEWEFAFDDEDEGLGSGWHDGRTLPLRIIVPFAYQTELSGINDKRVHEVVWYARSFELPSGYERDLLLNFGAVDYACTVWVNGHEVGHNRGGHVPFQFNGSKIARILHSREVSNLTPAFRRKSTITVQLEFGRPFGWSRSLPSVSKSFARLRTRGETF
jgi:hypothetical protein